MKGRRIIRLPFAVKIVLVNFHFGYYSRSNQNGKRGKDLNFRVYILAIAAFVVGTVELIIGGTLDLVANDLEYLLVQLVSLSQYFQ